MSSSKAGGSGQPPSRSGSSIVAHTARGYHIFKIDAYSLTKNLPTGDCIKSTLFTIGGHSWRIRYYPNGVDSETAAYISVFLNLGETVAKPVKAQYQFRIANEVVEDPMEYDETDSFEGHSGWGYKMFMMREKLESEHLKNDSFSIRCDILVINEFSAVDTPPALIEVPASDMHRHLTELLRTGKGADVVLNVGGETFTAHRWMLAARSPVFNAELFGMMKESDVAGEFFLF
ncbi:unnamed protein product [Urochloa humidicola]